MICAISGTTPQDPVISPNSGSVFDRKLIEGYIAEHGTDPISGDALSVDSLISIKTSITPAPRTPAQASIPALLQSFQNEWDALVLETLTLRQELLKTRQDLSTALYYHDAAVRVVAKLTKERDDAVAELQTLTQREL
ncbi:Prp19/Pso4-like-domain-containing protein [Lipomyces tetrasporus]|uniref:Pre-mRNA-processing factor 19 n=1 Tax=Lipomyces tetrasporus TaxID=54092 RepID=A0AAD7QWQ7_9ASCO|nr:Prp19/Pso4-like-domain-containing protein [Lipomyces tetrasporus]KAJ8101222.1 Prp19/Pso4-like-domain-containing protein [Lipomyces tetrasporus]